MRVFAQTKNGFVLFWGGGYRAGWRANGCRRWMCGFCRWGSHTDAVSTVHGGTPHASIKMTCLCVLSPTAVSLRCSQGLTRLVKAPKPSAREFVNCPRHMRGEPGICCRNAGAPSRANPPPRAIKRAPVNTQRWSKNMGGKSAMKTQQKEEEQRFFWLTGELRAEGAGPRSRGSQGPPLHDTCLPLRLIFKHFSRTCGFTVCFRRRIRPSWNWF